ncbi:MAG: hypothetical protein L0312_03505 [Acidobacteria bacterium]|nr:hypothetical protein [Acidobacteriota bacterium]
MNLTEAAAFLGVSPRTARLAVEHGGIAAEHPLPDGPWIFQRQGLEGEAAHALVQRVCGGSHHPAVTSEEQRDFEFSTT